MDLIYQEESYAIRGAIYEVYKELGCGFLESVYQEALEKELSRSGIPFTDQEELRVSYKGEFLAHSFRADIICYDKIILELKSVSELLPQHEAQLINYLKVSQLQLGFLINFSAHPRVEIRRFVL